MFGALYNTTGNNNTANGFLALYSNTTGYYNTANGSDALYNNTTGNDNTANGFHALFGNTTATTTRPTVIMRSLATDTTRRRLSSRLYNGKYTARLVCAL